METTRFNFQINPLLGRKPWERISHHVRYMADRVTAVHYAQKLARLFDAEVRMTEGNDPTKLNGSYFRAA